MSAALAYVWVIPVAIGVVATYLFAMTDLKSDNKAANELRD